MLEKLKQYYGHLFEKELLIEIEKCGSLKEYPTGFELIKPGSYVKSMPLILDGAIKVLRQDVEGDELLLYFLESGETCAMTLACCLGHQKSEIKAVTETDVTLIMIPIEKMETWTSTYKSWRNFVFESYHKRLLEAIETIDSIAFYNMDDRLIKYLNEKIKITQDPIIYTTHQEIAYDLHTSRVVISRLLKKLENNGKVKLHRNHIEVQKL